MTKSIFLSILFALSGCGSVTEPASMTYEPVLDDAKADNTHALCGGIAGFSCPDGQKCRIHETYPDAMGQCVGQPEYNNWRETCQYVKCVMPLCAEGWELFQGGNHCCPTCVRHGGGNNLPEGQCKNVNDCDGLIHILCLGNWSCDHGWCSYTCGVEQPL
jgi:hypothetical protein